MDDHSIENIPLDALEAYLFEMCRDPNPLIEHIGYGRDGLEIFRRIKSVQDEPQGRA